MTLSKTEKRTHDYTRHGTTNLFAALNTATGEVVGHCFARRRTTEFLKFMNQVVAAHDGREIHVVLDNLSTHSGSDVDKWLARHPNVTFHFTPTGSSWLNQVEIWFGIITKQAIRRGTCRSLRQLISTINTYITSWNHDSKPFIWTATANVRDPPAILKELGRVTKPGGRLALLMLHPCFYTSHAEYNATGTISVTEYFGTRTIEERLTVAGLPSPDPFRMTFHPLEQYVSAIVAGGYVMTDIPGA